MLWASFALGALLLVALLASFLEPRVTRGQRARRAHRGDVVHWYPNYDEDLRFEPRYEHDIVTISRSDLKKFGYAPGEESAPVPRTFRGRVAGDHRLRRWTSSGNLRSIWVCSWRSAIELSAVAHPSPVTRPLTREMLAPISGEPDPTPDTEHSIEMPDGVTATPRLDWDDIRPPDSPDLIHETDRFYCTETTPLSRTTGVDFAIESKIENPVGNEATQEVVAATTRPTKGSTVNRGRRRRRGRRR